MRKTMHLRPPPREHENELDPIMRRCETKIRPHSRRRYGRGNANAKARGHASFREGDVASVKNPVGVVGGVKRYEPRRAPKARLALFLIASSSLASMGVVQSLSTPPPRPRPRSLSPPGTICPMRGPFVCASVGLAGGGGTTRSGLFVGRGGVVIRPRRGGILHMSSTIDEDNPDADVTSKEREEGEGNTPLSTGDVSLGAWIPVGSASALRSLSPTRIEIMGHKFAVWYDDPTGSSGSGGGRWSVMVDVCPHRLAPLSQGRVDTVTGCIECPYHGWQFDTSGTLRRIPQWNNATDFDTWRDSNPNVRADSLPVHAAGDLLFAFLPTRIHGESFPRDMLPEMMYPGLSDEVGKDATYYVRDLPYSADLVVENFMDPAHVPFAHNGLQAVREDGTDIPMELLVMNFTHVEVKFSDVIRGETRDGIVSFQRPTYYHYRTQNKDGDGDGNGGEYKRDLLIHVVPVREGWSRVLFHQSFPKWIPKWLVHAASNRFLNTDTWMHDAERVLSSRMGEDENREEAEGGAGGRKSMSGDPDVENRDDKEVTSQYVLATSSDMGVTVFRRWWAKYGFSRSPPNTFGAANTSQLAPTSYLSRREQIDPWEYHTVHCSKCRLALRRWKRVELGGLVLSVCSASLLGRRWPVRATLLALGGLYAHVMSRRIATFIEGNPYPSGVADRSPSHLK